jgi:hypothetical protein
MVRGGLVTCGTGVKKVYAKAISRCVLQGITIRFSVSTCVVIVGEGTVLAVDSPRYGLVLEDFLQTKWQSLRLQRVFPSLAIYFLYNLEI